jgi:hypothetical protein
MFSKQQEQHFQVTMTSYYRSCPLDKSLTVCEIEGWSVAPATSKSPTATGVLPNANIPVILPPLIVKSQVMKRPCQGIKNNTQAGGTDTCSHTLRRRPFNSKIAAKRTRSWRT